MRNISSKCKRCVCFRTFECRGIVKFNDGKISSDDLVDHFSCFEPLNCGLSDPIPLTNIGGVYLDDDDLRELI